MSFAEIFMWFFLIGWLVNWVMIAGYWWTRLGSSTAARAYLAFASMVPFWMPFAQAMGWLFTYLYTDEEMHAMIDKLNKESREVGMK